MISSDRARPWTAALLLVFAVPGAPFGATAPAPKSVLLLHSFGRDIAPYDAIAAAFRTELKKGSSEPIALYDASVDAGQASRSNDPQPLIELLRQRFAGSPPDLVVTFGPLERTTADVVVEESGKSCFALFAIVVDVRDDHVGRIWRDK
jgi:hypothetical protein